VSSDPYVSQTWKKKRGGRKGRRAYSNFCDQRNSARYIEELSGLILLIADAEETEGKERERREPQTRDDLDCPVATLGGQVSAEA